MLFRSGSAQIWLWDELPTLTTQPGILQLTTRWRNDTGPEPLKIYVHLLDETDRIIAQWDGLDVAWEGWRAGDELWHHHELVLPPVLAPGSYFIHVGLYHPETAVRWQTTAGMDFVEVGTVEVEP